MRKHNYVVGYEGEGQCVYGKEIANWIDLLTLWQAERLAKKIISQDGKRLHKSVIYKLVKVKKKD